LITAVLALVLALLLQRKPKKAAEPANA